MKRAAAVGDSPNRITLLRDADGDGVAEIRETFLAGLNQPFGMALRRRHALCRQHRRRRRLSLQGGRDARSPRPGRKLMDLKPGGHWTRNLLVSPDQTKLYVGVGSQSNIGDSRAWRPRRAAPASTNSTSRAGKSRIFASGLRNPVGMAWEPTTGALWTVVNERDGLGDETPPDYLTSVQDGGFYGWPYCYWDRIVDDRVPQDPAKVATRDHAGLRARRPHRLARPLLASRPARCPAFRRAWRSASTARGTAARSAATR